MTDERVKNLGWGSRVTHMHYVYWFKLCNPNERMFYVPHTNLKLRCKCVFECAFVEDVSVVGTEGADDRCVSHEGSLNCELTLAQLLLMSTVPHHRWTVCVNTLRLSHHGIQAGRTSSTVPELSESFSVRHNDLQF